MRSYSDSGASTVFDDGKTETSRKETGIEACKVCERLADMFYRILDLEAAVEVISEGIAPDLQDRVEAKMHGQESKARKGWFVY